MKFGYQQNISSKIKSVEPETIHLIEDDERRLVYKFGYFIDENNSRSRMAFAGMANRQLNS